MVLNMCQWNCEEITKEWVEKKRKVQLCIEYHGFYKFLIYSFVSNGVYIFETVSNQTENNCKKWLNEEQVHQKNMSHEHALNLDQCKLFSENYTNGSLVMVGLQNYWD